MNKDEPMSATIRALVPRSALQVDATEAKAFADQMLQYAKNGAGLFPKDMTQMQSIQLSRLAIAYGLDPFAGEIILYQGRPYVTIDGRTRVAQEHHAYDGMEIDPATAEQAEAFGIKEGEQLWVARVWRKDRRFPFVGYGRSGGPSDNNPVSKTWKQEMAQKRAKHRALRDAFPMPIPGYEDQYHPDSDPDPPRGSRPNSGVVIEGEARVFGNPVENGVTNKQKAAIHAAVRALGWSDEKYRDELRQKFDVESAMDLTEGQASAFLETLAAEAEPDLGRVVTQDMVNELVKDPACDAKHWREHWFASVKGTALDTDERRAWFLDRYTKATWPKNPERHTDSLGEFLSGSERVPAASEHEANSMYVKLTEVLDEAKKRGATGAQTPAQPPPAQSTTVEPEPSKEPPDEPTETPAAEPAPAAPEEEPEEETPEQLAAKGDASIGDFNLGSDGIDEDGLPEPEAGWPPTEERIEPPSDRTAKPTLAKPAQKAMIQQLASPSRMKSIDLDTITQEDAALLIDEMRSRK
mgnify:FL=1